MNILNFAILGSGFLNKSWPIFVPGLTLSEPSMPNRHLWRLRDSKDSAECNGVNNWKYCLMFVFICLILLAIRCWNTTCIPSRVFVTLIFANVTRYFCLFVTSYFCCFLRKGRIVSLCSFVSFFLFHGDIDGICLPFNNKANYFTLI